MDKFSNLHFVCSFHNSDYRRYSRNAFRWTWLLNTQGQEDSPSLCRGEVAMPLGPKHHLSTTYEIFPRFSLRRHHCDYFINQVLMEHGTFDDHQARLKNNLRCPCGASVSMIQLFRYAWPRWRTIQKPTSRGTTRFESVKARSMPYTSTHYVHRQKCLGPAPQSHSS